MRTFILRRIYKKKNLKITAKTQRRTGDNRDRKIYRQYEREAGGGGLGRPRLRWVDRIKMQLLEKKMSKSVK